MLILSELLVLLHSYWLTGGFFDRNLLIAGFTIPIIVGFIGFGLVAFLVRYLHELEEEKSRMIALEKEAQEKLMLAASVFTHTHEGILISDADNKIIDVNEAFTTITGYLKADVLGKSPKILKSGRNSQEFYAQLWDSLHKDGVWKGELWNRKKTGEEYVENATISVVYDDNKAIQNYISIFTDISEQKRQHDELEYHAHYDVLTNLPNRMLFADRMNQAITYALRNKQLIAVVYIDIDGFKAVNDSYGHDVGDKLLVSLSEKMTNLLRKSDTVSRVGGDEFIALLVDVQSKESVTPYLSRLIETLAEPMSIDDLPINVSASIGVTFYPQNDELKPEQIIRQADKAMYAAKMSGKNRYVVFDKQHDNLDSSEDKSLI
jgi:diguanylate cyclase (GGDEF)-like protein/PAS domain S-box-containing protein